jgi:predicted  nucleic acid-binding Zn-ribbon protein
MENIVTGVTLGRRIQTWKEETTAKMGQVQDVLDFIPAKAQNLFVEPVSCERIREQVGDQLKVLEYLLKKLDKELSLAAESATRVRRKYPGKGRRCPEHG